MKYYQKLDSLRAIALFFVLFSHFTPATPECFYAGIFAFNVFFIMSGFLITSILLRPNTDSFKTNYKNFIGRRTLRIFPIYYLTILVLWLLHLDIVREKLIWFVTYTFNYAWVLYNLPITPATHFWSLALEEQFYLIWPLIALPLKNKKTLLIAILIVIISIGFAQWIFNIFPSLGAYNEVSLLTHMASMGLGCLAAILSNEDLLPDNIFKSKLVECIVFIVIIPSFFIRYRLTEVVFDVCAFYIVLKAAKYDFCFSSINRILQNKQLLRIGTISYGVYVFHLPLAYYFTTYIFDPFLWNQIDFHSLGKFKILQWYPWIIKFPLYTYLSILFASFSYKYIEMPILKLKDKYFKY
jgi:peptidoglycan/LPS O-acetylase OafA/YrhL